VPAVAAEYGRLRAAPGLVAAALAAVGMGALVVRRQRQQARPRLLGIVEAKKLRRRKARSRLANDPCGGPPPHLDEGRGRWESVPMAHPDVCSAQVRHGLILRLTEIVRPGHALGIDVSGAA
jgi:hypothetical protein